MDFVRSYFDKNEPLTSWTLFSSLFVQISADLEKKWGLVEFGTTNAMVVHHSLHFKAPQTSFFSWKKIILILCIETFLKGSWQFFRNISNMFYPNLYNCIRHILKKKITSQGTKMFDVCGWQTRNQSMDQHSDYSLKV